MPDPRICEVGGKGFIFPLLETEQMWPIAIRASLYIAALCWLFLGISIIADKFVSSIETITSQKKRIHIKAEGRIVTHKLWNDTVANLTLMALGSSAPEILLSIIETVKNGFHSGELGPSTIVGSAAFNLFMIIAVCILAIPAGEVRTIKATKVFFITALFSILAYLWLVVIVLVITPDVVDVWEALVTLLMMPVLVYVSYLADIGKFDTESDKKKRRGDESTADSDHLPMATRQWHGGDVDVAKPVNEVSMLDMLMFEKDNVEVVGTAQEQIMQVSVFRRNGGQQEVSCKYRTEALNAVPDYDYVHDEGDLVFAPGTTRAMIPIAILPKKLMEHSDKFQLILEDIEGGATFNANDDGGKVQAILTITILNESDALTRKSIAARAITALDGKVNMDSIHRGTLTWFDEIKLSLAVPGKQNDGQPCKPTGTDYIMHFIGLPWKFCFAVTIPPTAYVGGWPCFVFALALIGFLTSVVCDFAELLGCVLNVQDSVVAITFVALGTSMPDLFASKTSAVNEKTADASIVNVTGSNCVNVFLGIGLPWSMSALYWSGVGATDAWKAAYPDMVSMYPLGAFVVRGGDLGFSVVVFTVCAVIALGLIHFRRVRFGGELGGPRVPAMMSSILLSCLWIFYLALSIWKTISPSVNAEDQVWMIVKAFFFLQLSVVLMGSALLLVQHGAKEEEDVEKGTPPPLPPPPPEAPAKFAVRDLQLSGHSPHGQAAAFTVPPNLNDAPARPLGSPPPSDVTDEAILRTITVAAMTSWAAAKMKGNAIQICERQGSPQLSRQQSTFHDAESPRSEVERVPSFHSINTQAVPQTSSAQTPRGSITEAGKKVAHWASNHAADWVTLSVAGWLATQAAQAADPSAGLPQ